MNLLVSKNFGTNTPTFQITSEKELFNSPFFKEQKDVYLDKITSLQDSGIKNSAGQCVYCKSDKTFSTKRQVRSSDEGTTIFIFCISCQRTKRMN